MSEFALTILTPDKCFLSEPVEEIIFNTPEGRIGVMAGHMLMVAAVSEGVVDIRVGNEWKTAAISQGFAEIKGTSAEFFVDTVEWAEEIDTVRAKLALERAEMRHKSIISQIEYPRTKAAMARALTRLKAADVFKNN
jgi:F-type H+-transporting ATPase subunit epsilon